MMEGGGHAGGTWSSLAELGDRDGWGSSTAVGAQSICKNSGATDSACIAMGVGKSGTDDGGGCGDDAVLATAGDVGSSPGSAGGPVGEHTAGGCNAAGADDVEGAWKMDGGLSTGVEVCMAPGGDGTGGTVSVLDLRLSMSWRSVSTWTSCASSLRVTSPNFSFKSEHSLQALVVVAVVVCSLYSTLVPRSLDFDSHRGCTISTPSNSV